MKKKEPAIFIHPLTQERTGHNRKGRAIVARDNRRFESVKKLESEKADRSSKEKRKKKVRRKTTALSRRLNRKN